VGIVRYASQEGPNPTRRGQFGAFRTARPGLPNIAPLCLFFRTGGGGAGMDKFLLKVGSGSDAVVGEPNLMTQRILLPLVC